MSTTARSTSADDVAAVGSARPAPGAPGAPLSSEDGGRIWTDTLFQLARASSQASVPPRRIFLRKEMITRLDPVRVPPKKPLRAQPPDNSGSAIWSIRTIKTRAQGLVEYGLIVVGVVIAAVLAVAIIGPAISKQFSKVASSTA
jgi:hypothetical protein